MRAWGRGYCCHQLNKKTQEPWLQLWHFKNVTFIGIFFSLSFFHQKSKTPVVTTAEVSSDQSTNADSPEQPQAITMATQPKPSLSTVHVQQSFHGIRSSIPVLTHSASEVKFASCFYCNFDFCQPLSYISMLILPAFNKENLFNNGEFLQLMIISFIFITLIDIVERNYNRC